MKGAWSFFLPHERTDIVKSFSLTLNSVLLILLFVFSANLAFGQEDPKVVKMKSLCEEGNSTACFELGERYRTLERDNNIALQYFIKGCDAGHMIACTHGGILTQMTDKQYSPAWKRAAKMYQKACDAEESQACFNMGLLKYKEGRASSARKYFKIACDMKNQVACHNLKNLQK